MSKFQHLQKSFTCDPGRLKPGTIDICLWSLGVWGVWNPGRARCPPAVDKSVDNGDKWSLGSLGVWEFK